MSQINKFDVFLIDFCNVFTTIPQNIRWLWFLFKFKTEHIKIFFVLSFISEEDSSLEYFFSQNNQTSCVSFVKTVPFSFVAPYQRRRPSLHETQQELRLSSPAIGFSWWPNWIARYRNIQRPDHATFLAIFCIWDHSDSLSLSSSKAHNFGQRRGRIARSTMRTYHLTINPSLFLSNLFRLALTASKIVRDVTLLRIFPIFEHSISHYFCD